MLTDSRGRIRVEQLGAASSLPALLIARAATSPDQVAWRQKTLGVWAETDWAQLEARVAAYATGFGRIGVEPGTRVAMIVGPGLEAAAAGTGLLGMGACVVSLHPGVAGSELGALLAGADVRIAIVEDAEQLEVLREARVSAPQLHTVFVVEPRGLAASSSAPPPLIGVAAPDLATDSVDAWRASVTRLSPGAPALIALTVGGSGAPRPVTLSHANLMAAARA
ncbi:MAG: AMP-binding protein, partial [Acidimicrobiia bacterium]